MEHILFFIVFLIFDKPTSVDEQLLLKRVSCFLYLRHNDINHFLVISPTFSHLSNPVFRQDRVIEGNDVANKGLTVTTFMASKLTIFSKGSLSVKDLIFNAFNQFSSWLMR